MPTVPIMDTHHIGIIADAHHIGIAQMHEIGRRTHAKWGVEHTQNGDTIQHWGTVTNRTTEPHPGPDIHIGLGKSMLNVC